MASWASVAKATAQPSVAPTDLTASTEGLRLLVVDANAIISGVRLEGIADRAITIQEVYDEIRDKRSRQFLSTLPYQLQISEPTEESIKIVTRFARETGDVSTLSSNDIKLLALAHTLEVAAHGSAHLATHAAQPRMHSKPITSSQPLPGWGTVSNPEDWKVVDEANDADEATGASRIAQQVQRLTLDPAQPDSITAQDQPAQQQQELVQQQQIGTSGSPIRRPAAATTAAAAAGSEQAANGPAEAEAAADDSGWEVAASSAAAARRKKRKEHKRSERQRAFEAEWEEHARLVQEQVAQQEQQPFTAAKPAQQQNGTAAEGPEQHMEQQNGEAAANGQDDYETDSDACSEQDDEPATIEQLLAAEHQVYVEDDEADSDTAAADSADSSNSNPQQQQQQEDGLAPGMPGWQSSIASVTADFAMQNVLLQMGLRLITRDGRRIARLSRYALRCTACFTVTREAGRLFCPKCGNMTLDRVEVVTGPDGAEYFGIKKKHILRGTKFSLPKPRGGRNSKDPVLREDIFLLKVKALGRRAGQRRKQPVNSTADPAESGDADSGQQTYVASQTELAQHRGLAAVLQPAWKNNPNERKLTRSNRRR